MLQKNKDVIKEIDFEDGLTIEDFYSEFHVELPLTKQSVYLWIKEGYLVECGETKVWGRTVKLYKPDWNTIDNN